MISDNDMDAIVAAVRNTFVGNAPGRFIVYLNSNFESHFNNKSKKKTKGGEPRPEPHFRAHGGSSRENLALQVFFF